MKVELTENIVIAIEVALAELQTGEWTQWCNETEQQQVCDGESELHKIIEEFKAQ
jgi:hypothetical protein